MKHSEQIVKIKQGWVAIYVHEKLEGKEIKISQNYCELIAVSIPAINTINIVSYRPQKTKLNDFNETFAEVEEILRARETWTNRYMVWWL